MRLLVRRLFRNLRQSRFRMNSPGFSGTASCPTDGCRREGEYGYTACRQGRGECSQYGAAGTEPRGYIDSSPKQDDASEQPAASVFQSDEPEELPVAPVVQQEAPDQPVAPSYTESTPVEDILKVMTFEEAQNVVVDSGLSKGKTMATVAKERPVSLKFYLTPGNKSTNNIVRAAAQIMLDGMAAQKAG